MNNKTLKTFLPVLEEIQDRYDDIKEYANLYCSLNCPLCETAASLTKKPRIVEEDALIVVCDTCCYPELLHRKLIKRRKITNEIHITPHYPNQHLCTFTGTIIPEGRDLEDETANAEWLDQVKKRKEFIESVIKIIEKLPA